MLEGCADSGVGQAGTGPSCQWAVRMGAQEHLAMMRPCVSTHMTWRSRRKGILRIERIKNLRSTRVDLFDLCTVLADAFFLSVVRDVKMCSPRIPLCEYTLPCCMCKMSKEEGLSGPLGMNYG
eukprot:1146525-Pelagomonas_calceolata.AAC.1